MAKANRVLTAIPDLEELHRFQHSPEGLIAAHIVALVSTIADLRKFARDPIHLPLITTELADLRRAHSQLGRLIVGACRRLEVAA
jgi:hypothetical protein